MKRKIIQIASGNGVLALCDDGTVWRLIVGPSALSQADIWRQLPPLPQDEDEPKMP